MSKIQKIEPNLSERFSDKADTLTLLIDHATGGMFGTFNAASGANVSDERSLLRSPAIPKEIILPLIQDALENQRIEPYLASLMLVVNLGQPIKYRGKVFLTWDDFFPALIKIHNDEEPAFNTKRRHFLKSLERCRFASYKQLDACGLTVNYFDPKQGISKDTLWQILVSQDDKVEHDRRPTHVNKHGVIEFQDDIARKSYAAIPKHILFPLIKEAVNDGRMNPIQVSLMIATNVHAMELRRDDTRYLDHVLAVAADPMLTPRQSIIAILHDVLENSLWTANDLLDVGFDKALVHSVEMVTKPKHEIYMHFIQRVSDDPDALAVKMADIRHNYPTAKPDKKPKYELALRYLGAIKGGALEPGYSIEKYAREVGLYDPKHYMPEPKEQEGSNDNNNPLVLSALPETGSNPFQTGTAPA